MSTAEILFIGISATLFCDVGLFILDRLFIDSMTDWSEVGRWVKNVKKGRLCDPELLTRPPLKGENAIGWVFHYMVGIAFGYAYIHSLDWLGTSPSLLNGLAFGLVTLAAPFLIMKPAMGQGFFGSKTENPFKTCFVSVFSHIFFGAGLYFGYDVLV